ncbi:hypothetical protein Ana3638_05160 [Anaerocolumna sedimenticola]|uniref:Pilus assembly protein n=1 Tax=Anaerocolumna sedimenticola TaxID=2696063 RepID=A0A6P1TJI3_9FIRM|nr:TadE family protein [Anaerocolumna sedimenticola]QHQ60242.1 hypothetical protein Ana3638_05160 [Anaerocolumna sedimenticola]
MLKMVKGSYTIEAALIFPTILFIITSLIYLGFYLHDQDKLEAILDEYLIKGRDFIQYEADMQTGVINYDKYYKRGLLYSLEDNLKEKEQKICNDIQLQLTNGLFIAKVNSINVEASHTHINLQIKAEMGLPFIGLMPLFAESGTSITAQNKVPIENNAEFIRIFDIFFSVADKIPVLSESLKKLQEILNKFSN